MARNVFAQFAQPVKSVQEYDDERDAREVNKLALQDKRRANALVEAAALEATEDRNVLRQLAQEANGDPLRMIEGARRTGRPNLLAQAATWEKDYLGRQETQSSIAGKDATTAKTAFETQEAKRKAAIQQIASLNSPEEAIGLLNEQVKAGAIGMQAAQALERMVRSDPKWQLRLIVGISDPKEMRTALMPHMENAGGALVNTNPLAGPTGQGAPNAIPITQSADNAATQATSRANNAAQIAATMRGQNMTDARQREANAITQANARDKPLNETQAKALLFGTRMQEAEKAFSAMAEKNVNQRGDIKRLAEGVGDLVPFIGDKVADSIGTMTNWTQSAEQQQVEQAQRDFLNAVLRRESGAAIGASEFSNGVKQYFPQPGDSEEVIAQKARSRQLATRLMLEEVPEAKRGAATAPIKPGSVIKFDANGNRVQ